MGWDVTKVAAAHSALSGVLAAVVLVLMPITSNASQDSQDVPRTARSEQDTVMLLVLAFALLILSAIVWGSLAGNPDLATLSSLDDEVRRAQVSRSVITASVGVLLLAAGALAVMAGLLEFVRPRLADAALTQFEIPVIAIVYLAVYETAYFTLLALAQLRAEPGQSRANLWAILLALLVGSYLFMTSNFTTRKLSQFLWLRRLRWANPSNSAQRVLLLGVSTAIMAMGVYVAQPIADPFDPLPASDSGHWVSIILMGVATVGLCLYAASLTQFASRHATDVDPRVGGSSP